MSMTSLKQIDNPLDAAQAEQLDRLLTSLNSHQLYWVSGYLGGVLSSQNGAQTDTSAVSAALPELTVLFGSQTGNCEGIAKDAALKAEQLGFRTTVLDMVDCSKPQLKKASNLLIVVSTHGEGEPPDHAEGIYELIHSRKAPDLKDSRFSVLSLGDSSYELFCQTGRDFDTRLEALGAERIYPRMDCDVDYEDDASAWIDGALSEFSTLTGAEQSKTTVLNFSAVSDKTEWTRKHPFQASVLDNISLTGRGSSKKVHHIELSLEDSGIVYEPGDALGIIPQNNSDTVDELIAALELNPTELLTEKDESDLVLRDALIHNYEVTTLTRPFLEKYAALADSSKLQALLAEDSKDKLREYLYGRQLIDVLQDFPVRGLDAANFVATLRKLPPRLYSIASSHHVSPDEVHLTVAAVRYESHGRNREGVASTFLTDHLAEGDTVPVYIDKNNNFKLPQDPSTPIIMIGPGTGVAPFRAFMSEREELGAEGSNWLFFGDRNFTTDFLYQAEWLNWRKSGLLNRIDVAFSRDQVTKTYVQHRMHERSRELYSWLQDGAYLYVCGDAEKMAVDVHDALIEVVRNEGGLSEPQALKYVKQLQQERRYLRDVY